MNAVVANKSLKMEIHSSFSISSQQGDTTEKTSKKEVYFLMTIKLKAQGETFFEEPDICVIFMDIAMRDIITDLNTTYKSK